MHGRDLVKVRDPEMTPDVSELVPQRAPKTPELPLWKSLCPAVACVLPKVPYH